MMILSLHFPLLLSYFLITVDDASAWNGGFGLQSESSSSSSYASAAVFDPNRRTVTITGSTYGGSSSNNNNNAAGCLLAEVQLRRDRTNHDDAYWKSVQTLQTENTEGTVPERCAALIQMENPNNENRLMLAGTMEKGGLLNPIREEGTMVDTVQYGTILDLNSDNNVQQQNEEQQSLIMKGGYLMQYASVISPVAMAVPPTATTASSSIYTVSMQSDFPNRNELILPQGAQITTSAGLDPAMYTQYGKHYGMTVEKLHVLPTTKTTTRAQEEEGNPQGQTLNSSWRRMYHTSTHESVHVAGMVAVPADSNDNNDDNDAHWLVVAGSTSGFGSPFGSSGKNSEEHDMDGFVSLLNANNGELVNGGDVVVGAESSAIRIDSVDQKDDWVHGICRSPQDSDHVYLVGSTAGRHLHKVHDASGGEFGEVSGEEESTKAFLMKINIRTRSLRWSKEFPADPILKNEARGGRNVQGVACAVTPDAKSVYVAGTVSAGSIMREGEASGGGKGGTDLFVSSVDAETGQAQYMRQLGSDHDDSLAVRGGLVTDLEGNAIVVANTKGSFYRKRSKTTATSDVVVFTVERESGISAPSVLSDTNDTDPTNAGPTNAAKINQTNRNSADYPSWIHSVWLLILVGAAIFFYVARNFLKRNCFSFFWSAKSSFVETDRAHVHYYLRHYDCEQVELKHSATGGWHCTYVGALSQGIVVNLKDGKKNFFNGGDDQRTGFFGRNRGNNNNPPNILESSLFVIDNENENDDTDVFGSTNNFNNCSYNDENDRPADTTIPSLSLAASTPAPPNDYDDPEESCGGYENLVSAYQDSSGGQKSTGKTSWGLSHFTSKPKTMWDFE